MPHRIADCPSMTKSGAERLVAKIKAYWERRGYTPAVWIEPENTAFVIRSEMRGAQPPVFKSAKTTSVSAETAPEHQPER